jgi:pyridoxine kinase
MEHKNNPPRVAAIHDLSCFGRCALSVVTPVLSVMGCQVVPVPTALLSTHTGGFDGLYFRDLTPDMSGIISHFDRLGLEFDAIYSGFLGSAAQIDLVSGFIDRFGKDIPVLVDPVMGDDGSLYQTYTPELVNGMGKLCRKAGIITPNLTEACFLTGTKVPNTSLENKNEALALSDKLIKKLRETFGANINIVITGISFGDRIGNACAAPGEACHIVSTGKLPRSFPGTGEVFASVMLGSILNGAGLNAAIERAADFTYRLISDSQNSPTATREGVLLEKHLKELTE